MTVASYITGRANAEEVEIVEIEELPLAYLNVPAVRVRVKAAGPLSSV